MPDIFLGRQPIYGRDLDVFGYELLFRDSHVDRADIEDDNLATRRVIMNVFLEMGLQNVVGEGQAFINLPRSLIVSEACTFLPKDRVILEVLESVTPDAEVVHALKRLADQGYVIALDDHTFHPDLEPLVDLCQLVKLDILALGHAGIREHVARLKARGLKLLAEKIESYEDFAFCKDAGFDLFQGYFLCKPNTLSSKAVPSNRSTILLLLSRLQQPDIAVEQLVGDISRDVALTFKLLRYLNSAVCGLTRRVDSVREAVIHVGTNRLRCMASFLLLGSIDDKPRALVATALQRARMCELLAAALSIPEADRCQSFSVGLLSVLDALMDRPLDELLRQLPLSALLNDALLRRQGILGTVLHCVLAYEHLDWDNITCAGIHPATIQTAYFESIAWATNALAFP